MRYRHLMTYLAKWQTRYPWAVREPLGRSVREQPLQLFGVGNGKIHIHLNAAMHANEWLTAFVLARLGTRLCALWEQRLSNPHSVWVQYLQNFTLTFVPLVNPDGVQLVMDDGRGLYTHWKANIRGVDLNDQFPAGWERERNRRQQHTPGPRDYSGEAPLSEPEARAIAQFVNENDCAAMIAFHSQGREIYYNYRDCEPPEALCIAEKMASACGYQAIALTASDAGLKDWFIQQFRRPGFTVELGYGENPLSWRQFLQMSTDCERMVFACLQRLSNQESHLRSI